MYVSSSDYEGLSNSMLEAMAIGLPVICTDCPCGGARMVIKNYDNGILVPVRNTERLAEAMSEIADNYELSNMLSIRARRIREYLAPDKITAQWIQVIEALGKF
jgi:glycosyltransferase involved in cell wall biosynthesis